MAYVVSSVRASTEAAATSLEVALPAHAANDVIFVFVNQDTGTGTITISGYTEVTTQAASNAQRTAAFYKVAASSSEGPITVSSTLSEDINVGVVVVRGANTSAPVHASTRANTAAAEARPQAPALTTTVNDCLMLYGFGYDGSSYLTCNMGEMDVHAKTVFAGCMLVGSKPHRTAGAAPRPIARNDLSGEGGSVIVIAVADSGAQMFAPTVADGLEIILRLTGTNNNGDNVTPGAAASFAATIAGIAARNATLLSTVGSDVGDPTSQWGDGYARVGLNTSVAVAAGGEWMGGQLALGSSVNLSGKGIGLSWCHSGWRPAYCRGEGCIVGFKDGSGNWEVHKFAPGGTEYGAIVSTGLFGPVFQTVITPSATTRLALSGTLNWAAVTTVLLAFAKVEGTTANTSVQVQCLTAIDPTVVVGGSSAVPFNLEMLEPMLDGVIEHDYVDLQGKRQLFLKVPLQLGNGSTATYVDLIGSALDTPPNGFNYTSRNYFFVDDLWLNIRVKASASDVMRIRGCSLRTETKQKFIIDSASSPSATYDFAASVLIGWVVENNVSGVTINDASLVRCYTVSLNGGSLSGCTIDSSLDTVAVTTNDPSKISGCLFVSDGTGHAIEITTPGTYTFSGNTFSGYGSAGSTDAAIYNNSGGAVTLNISGGGGTPTVRNGTSASTTINNNVSLTLDNVVVGSAIRIEKVSDGSLVEFRTAASTSEAFSVPASVNYRVKVRKATSAPLYKPYESQSGALSADTSIYVSQIPD